MKSLSKTSILKIAVASFIMAILLCAPTPSLAQRDEQDNLAYPPDSTPFGMTYGDWIAAWWQYVLAVPASTNPALDTTGQYCNLGQSSGPVFFLNSSFVPGVLVTRACTIHGAKALYIPNVGCECSTAEAPPFHGDNGQELRTCTAAFTDGVGVRTMKVTVDGRTIENLGAYRAQSPMFDFVMPAHDNFLGVDGVTSGSSVADIYGVMLKPLSPGRHVVHFEGRFVSGPAAGAAFAVTYYLTID